MRGRNALLPLALLLVLGFAAWSFYVLGGVLQNVVAVGRHLFLAFAQFGLAAFALFAAVREMARGAVVALGLHFAAVVACGITFFSDSARELSRQLLVACIGGEAAAVAAGVLLLGVMRIRPGNA